MLLLLLLSCCRSLCLCFIVPCPAFLTRRFDADISSRASNVFAGTPSWKRDKKKQRKRSQDHYCTKHYFTAQKGKFTHTTLFFFHENPLEK